MCKGRLDNAKTFPISVATVNFKYEVNLAYIIRSAVCFGAEEVCVIGTHPSRKLMNELSASLFDYISIKTFSDPSNFLRYLEQDEKDLISIELPSDSFKCRSLLEYEFDFSKKLCLMVGHETLGVPVEILAGSKDIVYIEMSGVGSCLNVAAACNIALYEATKQFKRG